MPREASPGAELAARVAAVAALFERTARGFAAGRAAALADDAPAASAAATAAVEAAEALGAAVAALETTAARALAAGARRQAEAAAAAAVFAAVAPACAAMAAAARGAAPLVDATLVDVPAGAVAYLSMYLLAMLVSISESHAASADGAFAPAAVAAACAAAGPILDAAGAMFAARPQPGRPEGAADKAFVTFHLLQDGALPGSAAALRRILGPARVAGFLTPTLAALRAEWERARRRALPAAELLKASIHATGVSRTLDSNRLLVAGAQAPPPELVREAAALCTLLLAQAAAATGGAGVTVAALATLPTHASAAVLQALDGAGAAAPWAPWALRHAAVSAAALIRWHGGLVAARADGWEASLGEAALLASDLTAAAGKLLAAGRTEGVAASFGAVVAAIGVFFAHALREPRLEALTRRAGAPLAAARVGLERVGAMELSAEELAAPAGWEPSAAAAAALAVLGALPRVEALARAPGLDGDGGPPAREGVALAALHKLARHLQDVAPEVLELREATDHASGRLFGRPLDFCAVARLAADALPPDGCARVLAHHSELARTAEWARIGEGAPPPRADVPADAHLAAALAGAALARRILDDAPARAGDAAAALRSARVLAGLAELADAATGTFAALWAAGGALEALHDAARGACAGADGGGGGADEGGGGDGADAGEGEGGGSDGDTSGGNASGGEDVASYVSWLAAYLEQPAGGAATGRAAARLVAASGAPRLLARHAAACWRVAAAAPAAVPARAGAEGPAGAPLPCAAGFGGSGAERSLDLVLARSWAAALVGADAPVDVQVDAWMAEGGVVATTLELSRLGAPGDELALAATYEKVADWLGHLEAPAREAFERDEAPAARLAAARAIAQHFGCGNLRCARAAGLSRADAKALFPPKRCSICLVARYCSAECQRADWVAGHRGVCRALAAEREGSAIAE